ncbi:von Willebrand factor [Novipirellula aureliae]|uniref:von Willebrand factor n=1 Tax=Novipirellula aureliae TaxID=2527966 RepID=A0A5C6EFL1_9BACT|nr:von Willebrand factor type A domain-containing protein [Novipirellula aureliae]TWU46029.1 von Willebrand factor [Novipirellula aureliae]
MNNKPYDPPIDPEIEERIIALVLGEASEFEQGYLSRLIEQRPELATLKAQYESVHGLLEDVGTGELPADEDSDWILPDEKRSRLLAVLRGEASDSPANLSIHQPTTLQTTADRGSVRSYAKMAAMLGAACVLAVLGIGSLLTPSIHAARETARHMSVQPSSDTSLEQQLAEEAESFERSRETLKSDLSEIRSNLAENSSLPSPYYLQDDVQYFPAGPEFKLPQEAAALKRERAKEKLAGESTEQSRFGYQAGVADKEAEATSETRDGDSISSTALNEFVPELGTIVIRGARQDVKKTRQTIEAIAQDENERKLGGVKDQPMPPQGSTSRRGIDVAGSVVATPTAPSVTTGLAGSLRSAYAMPAGPSVTMGFDGVNGVPTQAKALNAGDDSYAGGSGIVTKGQSLAQPQAPLEARPERRAGTDLYKSVGPPRLGTSHEGDEVDRDRDGMTGSVWVDSWGGMVMGDHEEGRVPRIMLGGIVAGDSREPVELGWRSKQTERQDKLERLKRQAAPGGIDETNASDEPFSTFSLHVSDVSFKLSRAALARGEWPEAAMVRIEEFVNAFDYGDPLPRQNESVACRVEQSVHPFVQQRNLLRVSMRTAAAGRASTTPLRLTFLLDNSGSMERMDRQQTVRRAFATLAAQLTPIDQVTLISFARQPRLLADKVTGDKANELVPLIENLPSEGGTNIESALQLAFEKAQEQMADDTQSRIVLLTDGAVNLGDANPDRLSQMITTIRDAGIAFDAAGISAEGLNDEILEALTRKGDGRYYLLDSAENAEEGFASQIAGALRPSAKNVKVQIEFNPHRVGRYKLLGFEKHRLKQEDFRNDAVDAAEMAAAEAGVAVYQFEAKPEGKGDVGSVSVRFRDLSTGQMIENRWPIPYEADALRAEQAAPSLRIAAAAAMFAAKLRGEPLGDTVDLKTLSEWLSGLPDQDRGVKRVQQLQQMIEQARQLSER